MKNARTLGLFVSDATNTQENPEEFAELFAGYVADYRPQGTVEFELVRQLTSATWRLRRFDRMETARYESDDTPQTRHEASASMALKFESEAVFMDRIYRSRQQAERTFNRLYKDLETRKSRRITPREAPEELQIEMDSRHQPFPQIKPKSPQPQQPCVEMQNEAKTSPRPQDPIRIPNQGTGLPAKDALVHLR